MTDSTRVNELQDKLLQAMDIINEKALSSVSYDKTITCTIKDDKNAKKGEYTVYDGSRLFEAYSNDTSYKIGTTVFVTIPEGKFENQKMIIGKKTSNEEKPFVFTEPFDTIFDMTGNIAATASAGALTANDILDEHKEIDNETGQANVNLKDCFTSQYLLGTSNSFYNLTDKELIKYTRLGIKADFTSWVKQAVKGTYGLIITLKGKKKNIVESEKDEEIIKEYVFDNSQMFGNTYNFETPYEQQVVIDLEQADMGQIIGIKVEFAQSADFYDQFNEPIPSTENGYLKHENTNKYQKYGDNNQISEGITTNIEEGNGYYKTDQKDPKLLSNLKVNNLYICFGYDISIFNNDYVEIFTENGNSYKRSTNSEEDNNNEKIIKTRWVHIIDGKPINMTDKNTNKPDIETKIRWYKYRIGAPATDEYSGVYWEQIKDAQEFNLNIIPDVNKQQEKIKLIILEKRKDDSIIAYKSNELIFENEEEMPPSQEAQHIANALQIIPDDGLDGNYMLYGQDDHIKDIAYANEIRTLSCKFDANNDGVSESNVDQENLIWYFPKENSMIKLLNSDTEKGFVVTGKQPQYEIASYYTPINSNNTIQCQYTLNGAVYVSEIEFTFGAAGTMGSDQTLVIDFEGDKKAIQKDEKTASFQIRLYDNQNKLQKIPDGSVRWAWYYHSDQDDTGFQKVLAEKGNAIYTFQNYSFSINKLYILQATVGNLTAYFSIPIKDSNDYSYIKGPTQVIYQSNGEPSYNRDKYELYDVNRQIIQDIKWQIKSTDNDSDDNLGRYDAELSTDYRLKPIECYVSEAPVYGVQALSSDGKILWTQPILVLQNRWGSNVINKWDGKSITMDESFGTILTSAIAAGKKESDNSFTGIMAGSWGKTDTNNSITEHTGIYGFHKGAQCYALKDDGTAFFGKNGKGRINIDGNEATIYSTNWEEQGMMIDLNDPFIKLNGNYSYKVNEKSIIERGSIVLNAKEETQYPFQIGTHFKVKWDGTIYAIGGHFSGEITANSGTIGSWKIVDVDATTNAGCLMSSDGSIILDPSSYGTIIMGQNSIISGGTLKGSIFEIQGTKTGDRTANVNGGIKCMGRHTEGGTFQEIGQIGLLIGSNTGIDETLNVGIISKLNTNLNSGGIILQSEKHIRIQANSYSTGSIYLYSNELHVSAPKNKQFGIYARFA